MMCSILQLLRVQVCSLLIGKLFEVFETHKKLFCNYRIMINLCAIEFNKAQSGLASSQP